MQHELDRHRGSPMSRAQAGIQLFIPGIGGEEEKTRLRQLGRHPSPSLLSTSLRLVTILKGFTTQSGSFSLPNPQGGGLPVPSLMRAGTIPRPSPGPA